MPQAANIYASCLVKAFAGDINLTTDRLNMALLGSGYTPNLVTDVDWSDISANEISGTGYVSGGNELTSVSLTLTAANSWSQTWAATTTYSYGSVVKPSTPNGLLYRCVVAGTSGGSAPSFPTVAGVTVTDGSATWATLGDAILVFTSDAVEWSGATFSANYAVIYDAQSGTYSTESLLVLETFGETLSPSGVPFQVIPDPVLGWGYWSPPS